MRLSDNPLLCENSATPQLHKLEKPRGVLTAEVAKESPAEKAGLINGDLLTEFNGKSVKDPPELRFLIMDTPVGKAVKIKILRGKKEKLLAIEVGYSPPSLYFSHAYINLGWAYSKLGRHQAAEEAYQQAIKIKPDSAEAYDYLGLLYGDLRRWKEVIEAYIQFLQIKPDNANAYYNIGRAYENLKRWQEATEAFHRAIQLKPDFIEAHYDLGRMYCNLSHWQGAAKAFQHAIQLKPDFAEALSGLGWVYGNLGRWQEAAETNSQAVKLNPHDANVYYNLGLASGKLERYQEASEAYKQAVQLKPDYTEAQYNLGWVYSNLGRWQEAAEAYQQAIYYKPDYLEAYGNLGWVYTNLGRWQEAAEAYIQVIRIQPDEPNAHHNLGWAYSNLGRWQEAIESYLQAIRLKPGFSTSYYNLGIAYRNLHLSPEAIAAFREATRLKPDFADAFHYLGVTYSDMKRWQEAAGAFLESLRAKPDNANVYKDLSAAYSNLGCWQDAVRASRQEVRIKPDSAEAYLRLGFRLIHACSWQMFEEVEDILPHTTSTVYSLFSKIDSHSAQEEPNTIENPFINSNCWEATDVLQEALNLQQDSTIALGAYYLSGLALSVTGQLPEALFSYQRYREIAWERKDLRSEALALTNVAEVFGLQGDVENAHKHFLEALQIFQQIDEPREEVEVLMNLVSLSSARGEYDASLNFYYLVIDKYKKLKDQQGEWTALIGIGDVYYAVGDNETAIRWYQTALAKSMMVRDVGKELQLLTKLLLVYHSIGNKVELKEYLLRAEKAASDTLTRLKNWKNLNDKDQHLSQSLQGNAEKLVQGTDDILALVDFWFTHALLNPNEKIIFLPTISYSDKVSDLDILRFRETYVKKLTALAYLGRIYGLRGEFSEAIKTLQLALKIGGRLRLPEVYWILNEMGAVEDAQGQFQDALGLYTQAVENLEKLSSQQQPEETKMPIRELAFSVYENIVTLLFKLREQHPERLYAEQAFLYHEKGKARILLDLLEEAKIRVRKEIDPTLSKEEERVLTRLSHLRWVLANSNLSPEQKKLILITLAEQEQTWQALQVKMALSNPKYAELTAPQIADVPQVQALLDKDTLFLEYALGEKKSFLWGVTQDGMQVYELPVEAEVARQVEQYLSALKDPPPYTKEEIARQLDLGKSLYRTLLQPAASQAQGKSQLIIVPDGILNEFPFEVLITEDMENTGEKSKESVQSVPYLGKRYTMTYTPSASVLVSLEKNRSTRSAEKPASQFPLLAFGDPQYDAASEPPTLALNVRGVYEERDGGFQRLKYSAQEVEKIAKVYGITLPSEAVNIQEQATEKHLREMDLTRYRILHFATHAIVGDDVKWITQPALILSQTKTDELYDGLLQMGEIFNLRLNADLVVLSACETGKGKLHRGEGIVGLTRAFFYAGTPSVVASLWKVNDQSTSILMESFYRNLKEGKSKAEALRLAKVQLIETHTWSDTLGKELSFDAPYFWAPFVLIGSGS